MVRPSGTIALLKLLVDIQQPLLDNGLQRREDVRGQASLRYRDLIDLLDRRVENGAEPIEGELLALDPEGLIGQLREREVSDDVRDVA